MAALVLREYGAWTPVLNISGTSEKARDEFLTTWARENERLKRRLGLSHDCLAIRVHNGKSEVRVQGVAGLLRIGEHTFRVAPKCLSPESGGWERSLLRLISVTNTLQFDVTAPHDVEAEPKTTFVDHIAQAFAEALEKGLHSGPLLFYQEQEVISDFARGRLILEPYSDLIVRPHKVRCLIDEMDLNNPYTSLLMWALDLLQLAARKPSVRAKLQGSRAHFPGVVPSVPSPSWLDRMQVPIQYKQYEPSLRIAAWLARGEALGQYEGHKPGGGLILDMARVYERFVSYCLNKVARRLKGPGISVRTVPQAQDVLARELGGRTIFSTRPDDRLLINGQLSLLVDAKYKGNLGDKPASYLRPESDDFYQMTASCMASGCRDVLLVYPHVDSLATVGAASQVTRKWRVRNKLGGSEISVTAMGIDLNQLANPSGLNDLLDTLTPVIQGILSPGP